MSFNVSQYSREKKNNDQAPVTGQSGPGINLSELARQAAALDAERRRREQEEAALSRSGPSQHSSSSRFAEQNVWDRISGNAVGAAKDYIGSKASFYGNALEGLVNIGERLGGNTSDYAGWATDELSAGQIGMENDPEKRRQQRQTARDVQEWGYRQIESGARDMEKAQAGVGMLGRIGLGIESSMIGMAGDKLESMAIPVPGMSLISLGTRAAGSGMYEADKAGASYGRKMAYGLGAGGLEAGSEMLFGGLSKIYGRGIVDNFGERIIRRMVSSDAGRKVLLALGDMGEEAVEEAIVDLVDPLIKTVYNGKSVGESYRENFDAGQMLEDALVGGLMGAFGAGTKAIGTKARPSDYSQTVRKMGYADTAEQQLLEKGWNKKDSTNYSELIAKQVAGESLNAKQQAMMDSRPAAPEIAGEIGKGEAVRAAKEEHAQTGKQRERLDGELKDFFRKNLTEGEVPDAVAEQMQKEYDMNPETGSAAFAYAAREAFQYGNLGLSLSEAKAKAQMSGSLTGTSFEHIWKLGAMQRVGGEEKGAGEVKNEVRAHLAKYGEEGANRLAAVHDGLTTAEEYAEIVDKAVFYAKNGADLQTVVEEIRSGLKTTWAQQDHELTKLTPEQITAIQELGPKIAAQRAAEVQRQDARLTQIREAAQGVTALKQVNRQLSAARGVLAKAEANLKEAEAEMRQMQDSGAWSTEEEAYNEVVRRVERLDDIIEKGKKVVQELEAKRAEAQNREPIKRKQGTVSFDESVDRENLTRDQKKVVAFVEALADAVNIDYVLYAGKDTQGGLYKDGMLHININAALKITKDGKVESRSVAGAILSHELTHYLQQYAPKEYEALRDFVIEKIRAEKGERGFSKLVQDQIDMERSVKKLSYDQAVDELVANSCITMLADSQTVKELARKNMTLAEKIADFLTDFAEKIRAVFEGVDIHDDSGLYDAARAMEKYFGEMQKMWDAALKSADVNYNAAQADGETAGGAEHAMAWGDREGVANARLEPIEGALLSSITSWEGNVIVDSHQKVVETVDDVLKHPGKRGTAYFGIVNRDVLNEIQKKATSVPKAYQDRLFAGDSGFVLAADYDDIAHMIHENSLTRAETIELLDRMADIVIDNDTVKFSYYTRKQQPQPGLLFEKVFPDGTYGSYDLVSRRRKRLGMHTMYIEGRDSKIETKEKPSGSADGGIPQPTSETTESLTSDNSVPNKTATVKENSEQFMMLEPVEETDRLVAVHNKSVSGLRRMLQRGGVPYPSIAIKKAGTPHEGFGDVSIVFPRSSIDPKVNRQNRIYSNDAWTPTEPVKEYDVGNTYRYSKKLRAQVGDAAFNGLYGPSTLEESEMAKLLQYSQGKIAEALKGKPIFKYAYLDSIGKTPQVGTTEKVLDNFGTYKNSQLLAIFDGMPDYDFENLDYSDEEALERIAEILQRQFESTLTPEQAEKVRKHPLYTAEKVRPLQIRDAYRRYKNSGMRVEMIPDYSALDRDLRGNVELEKDEGYIRWLEETFKDLIVDEGIRNDKDLFTSSGNRRSFKSLHIPATLDNIVKLMQKQQERGNGLVGINLRGAATKSYNTVEEARAERGRLLGTHIADDVYDSYMKGFYERLHGIVEKVSPSDRIESWDSTEEILLEAVRDTNSLAAMTRKLNADKRWLKGDLEEAAKELWQLKNDVQNMPAPYFEAKPRRIVYPGEALAYILPDNADADVVKSLKDIGYDPVFYKAGDSEDRLAKLNSIEGAQFMSWEAAEDERQMEELDEQIRMTQDAIALETDRKVLNSLNGRLARLEAEKDGLVAKERRLSRRTSVDDILVNLGAYRKSDLLSIAEQYSREWDIDPDISREDLEAQLREALLDYAEELTPLERQAPAKGFYVRPVGGQYMTWGDQVSFDDLLDEKAQMSMDDLEDEALPGEGFEEWRRNDRAAAKTMPGMEKVPAQLGPRRERALAAAITQQTKKLLEGYTPTDWDRSITAEDIDGWLDADEYHGVMGSMFDDGMQAADLLYDLAQAQQEKAEDAYLVMEQLTRTMNPVYAQVYTVPGGYDRTPGFTEWYMRRNPSVYYPGYKPGDLFEDSLWGEGKTAKEIEYLNELLNRPEVSPEKKAEAQAFLDRLTAPEKRWQVFDRTIDPRSNPSQMREYQEVFYMSWDNDHNDWAPEFYSKLNQTVAEWTNDKGRPMPEKMGAGAVIPWLRGRGVKAEEIRWSGLQPWLDGRKSVTKDELAAYLAGNMTDIQTEVLNSKKQNHGFLVSTSSGEDLANFDVLIDALEWCMERARKEYGEDAKLEWDQDEDYVYVYLEENGQQVELYAIDTPWSEEVEGDTEWMAYRLRGGSNYREILFKLPGLTHMNNALRVHWKERGPGTIAHARIQDMEEVENGKRVLFVEEIQSDLHNEGAKKGFEGDDGKKTDVALQRLKDKLKEKEPAYNKARSRAYEIAERIYKDWKESGHRGLEKTSEDTLATFISGKSGFVRDVSRDISAADMLKEIEYGDFVVGELINDNEWEEIRSIRRAVQEHDELAEEYGNVLAGSEKLPPDVPFAGSADTYHEYVMKHLLRLAAEGDYDAIGWTTAQQQADRWSDEFMEGYKIEYDQALPKFMNKYTKQWGGKVGDLALAVPYTNGQETRVWAVEITPEMKKAVLQEGQPLFMSWDGMEDTEQEWQDRLEAYSRLEAEQAIQDQVFQSIRELTRSQKKSLAEIQKRLKIGKTPEARMDDVQRMARSLISKYNSTMKEEDVIGEIAAIWNYVLQDTDPSGNVVRNMAEELAEKIVDSAEAEVIDETEEETLKEIRNRIRGQKLVIGADETGDIPGYANLAEFRKKNFGRFSVAGRNSDAVTDQHVPVDSLYEELRNSYGDYYFPESTSQGEMLGILSGYFDAAERQTANPFSDSYGEAVEAIAGEITRSAWWDAVRLTPLTESEQAKVRNAEGREIIQNLRDERKITKGQAEKLEAPMAAEEQLMDQAEALKAQIRELVEAGEMSKAEAAELQASLLKMTRRVDTLEEQYRLLEEAADKRVAQIREEGAAKVAEAIAKQQEKNAKNVQALKDHFKEVQQNARARREESGNVKKYREQVAKKAKKLFEMLMTNSDQKHVPEALKGPLAQFLTELDFTSKRQLRGGDVTKNDRAFAANLQRLEQILSNQQAYISGDPNAQSDLGGYIDVSQDNLEYLRQVSELITKALTRGETFTINSMTGAQLKDLSKLLSNLYTAINRMNDFMANARYATVREAAAGDIGYFNSLGEAGEKAESRWRNWVYWKDGVPYYVFNRFGEGGKSIFDGFTRGWEKLAFRAQEIINFTEALYTDKEVGEWTKDLHEFTLEDGSKIRMTTAQVMELSMLLGREQAQKHIMKGGIRIGTVRTKKGAVNDTNHYHLTAGDIANIAGSLTARQAEVARALQRFMAEKGAEWGNEISMRRFGYNFYTEGENYYPIRTDPSDRPMSDTDMPQNASMFRLLNLSSSKALNPKASNALIVGDIFDTFANHTSDMAKLNAMGLPVLDAIKWFNYKERVNINMETGEHTTKTLQRAMERAYGTQAGHYFRTLMKDINGVVEAGDRGADVWSNLTARYKAVAVGANLRVALLQPTSYLRALNVIDGKYLAAAFAHRNAYKEAMQYSGTAVWKSMGYYDTDISKGMRGQIKHDDTWKDKVVETSMKAAEIGDKRTWGRLWVACKLQTKAQNPELSGEELKQATADLFRKVIYASQVMDSTLTRSEMMRSKSIGDKLLTPFMAEPTLSFNILMDAYSGYALDERRLGRAEAWKKNAGTIGRALTAYIATAAFNALAESIWDAVRDDDDEDFLEKFLQALFGEDNLLEGNLVQDLLISNKIPGVKDVISMLTGYTNRNIATEGIENIINAARIWLETWQLANGTLEKATKVTYYGRMTEWGRIYKSLQALSQVTGLPIYPLTREAVAIWNTLMNGRKDEWKILTYDANQLSDDAMAAWKELVEPTGISQKQFKKIMNEADSNGSVQPTQDELGTYLLIALADGAVTEEQAAALWDSRGWKHDFGWWRDKNAALEQVAQQVGFDLNGEAAPAEEVKPVKTQEPKTRPEPTPTPTPTPTPKLDATPKPAATPKPKPAEKKDEKTVTDRETFKKYVPVYSDNADTAYDLYESEVRPLGISLEKYSQIIIDANADGKGTSTQDEMGNYLVSQVKANKITQEQADAIWHTIWSKPKSKTFQKWLQKNYNG